MTSPPTWVFDDDDVTSKRVTGFANAPKSEQDSALLELRKRSSQLVTDAAAAAAIAIGALVGLLSLFIAAQDSPRHFSWWTPITGDDYLWLKTAQIVAIAVVAIIVVIALQRGAVRRHRAGIWLASYEAELERRWLASGRRAKEWRQERPIDWG